MIEKWNFKNSISNSTHKHETFRDKHKKCGRCFHKKVQTLLGYISKNLNNESKILFKGWKTQYFEDILINANMIYVIFNIIPKKNSKWIFFW